jgi:hypothetical protein
MTPATNRQNDSYGFNVAPVETLKKTTRINERFALRLQADAFNLTNTPSFDAPNNDLSL